MQTLKAQIIDQMTINKFAFAFCLYCDMKKKPKLLEAFQK